MVLLTAMKSPRIIKNNIIYHLILDATVLVVAMGYYFIVSVFKSTCIIKYIFGIECPTCGMTRAIISLFSGDIKGYFKFNFMAIPLLCTVYLYLHSLLNKKLLDVLVVIVAFATFTRYIIINFIL